MSAAGKTLARTVLRKNLHLRKGESVLIESWPHTLDYAADFVTEARRMGARPTILYEDEAAWWDAVSRKNYGPLRTLSKAEKAAIGSADAYVYFWGPGDALRRRALPESIGAKVTEWNEEWYRTARKGGLRGVRMNIGLAPDQVAKEFGLSGKGLRERLAAAGAADAPKMAAVGARILAAIKKGKKLHLTHRNGTDLWMDLRGVHGRVDAGIVDAETRKGPYGMMANNPTGLVMVAVDRANAVGTVVANRAVYDFATLHRFTGAAWTFEKGRLARRAMGEGKGEFEKGFANAGEGRDQLSYFSVGLNPAAKDLPPCEDTEEGAVLLSVGNNHLAGGKIGVMFRGYAMVAGGDVEVDGRRIVDGGRLRTG